MPSIDFATFCHAGDMDALYRNLSYILESHDFEFNRVHVIHQRCTPKPGAYIEVPEWASNRMTFHYIHEAGYDYLLSEFGIPTLDKRADEITHGPGSPHYWKNHVVNHLCAVSKSDADYIVFSDSDCIMVRNNGWVQTAAKILDESPHTFCVSPCEGTPGKTQTMSQQLFMARRKELLEMNWNCWDGKFIEGGPMQEYYPMAEGRIGMYMLKTSKHRLVLGEDNRYWHSPNEHPVPEEFKEAVKGWK